MPDVYRSIIALEEETRALELFGEITRLQVQIRSLKAGDAPHRWYDPSGIELVEAIEVDENGVTGFRDGPIADIHNRRTEHSRHRGDNGVSFGFETHYAAMADRFGAHLTTGVAGENILVRSNTLVQPEDIQHGLVIVSRDDQIKFGKVIAAPPCVEFSRFCARYTKDQRSDVTIKETLQFLSDGMRGLYGECVPASPRAGRIRIGDLVYRRLSQSPTAG